MTWSLHVQTFFKVNSFLSLVVWYFFLNTLPGRMWLPQRQNKIKWLTFALSPPLLKTQLLSLSPASGLACSTLRWRTVTKLPDRHQIPVMVRHSHMIRWVGLCWRETILNYCDGRDRNIFTSLAWLSPIQIFKRAPRLNQHHIDKATTTQWVSVCAQIRRVFFLLNLPSCFCSF